MYIGFIEEGVSPQVWSVTNLDYTARNYSNVESMFKHFEDTHSSELNRYDSELNIKEYAYIEYQMDAYVGYGIDVSVFGPDSTIAADVQWAKDNVTVDGNSVLENLDTATIHTATGGTTGHEPIPVPSELTMADGEGTGVISDSAFESQVTGTAVTWDTTSWQFAEGLEWSLASLEDDVENDHIFLFTPDFDGRIRVAFYGPGDPRTIDDWVERWSSVEYQKSTDLSTMDSRIDDTNGGAIFETKHLYGETLVIVRISYTNDNGEFVVVDILASTDNIADVYDSALESIELDGGEITPLWTSAEVDEIVSES